MRRLVFSLLSIFIFHSVFSQQISLYGVVSVQNSKTNTGKVQYVKNAQVLHPNAKPALSDDAGFFQLNISGLKPNTQTGISLSFSGVYRDFMVVNERDINDITLGREEQVKIYIGKRGRLKKKKAKINGINIKNE